MNKKYYIIPKVDFGNFVGARPIGFVVTDGICNVMPAACWFKSIESAETGIKALEMAKGNSDEFWNILRMWFLLKKNQRIHSQTVFPQSHTRSYLLLIILSHSVKLGSKVSNNFDNLCF